MPPTEPEISKNPMKKRFRSWQPAEEPAPPRRRRYPQLVVRDGTGHHIANDIATAPKVELPLPPIMSALPATRNPPTDEDGIQPNRKRESEIDEPEPESPLDSASTLDRTHHIEGHSGPRSPFSPVYDKPRPQNSDGHSGQRSPFSPRYDNSRPRNDAVTPPSGNVVYRPARVVNPVTQPPQAPVSAARVNPVVMQSHSDYPSDAPPLPARPRTSGGYAPHNSISPPSSAQPMAPSYGQGNPSYPAGTSPYPAQEQTRRYAGNIVGDGLQRTNAHQMQPAGYAGSQAGSKQPATEPQASKRNQSQEKVILAGKRCGTVEYWRSSLQMPREKGVIKSLKAPPQYYKRKSKQETPEQTDQLQPANNAPPRSTSVPPPAPAGQTPGYPSASNTSYQPQRTTYPEDYTQNQSSSERDYSSPERGEGHPKHEFWRSATKLPRVTLDSDRMKKLASGKRRLDSDGVSRNEPPPALVPNDTPTNAPAPPIRQYGTPHRPGSVLPRRESEYAGPAVRNRVMQVKPPSYIPQGQGRSGRPLAESETRRLLFLRDFEMRRLKTNAQGKFHVKMNLRGRAKLENWICSDSISWEATNVVLSMFNTDRRVLSKNDDVRRNALYDMSNEDLRILEALMARIQSRGGRQNWEMLVTHLPYEDFVKIPMSDN